MMNKSRAKNETLKKPLLISFQLGKPPNFRNTVTLKIK